MNFINNSNKEDDNIDVHNFVIPQFLKSGLYRYVIQFKEQLYYHKDVIQFRKETIPFRKFDQERKQDDEGIPLRIFAVFNNWREDNQAKFS